jgi:hypothetical protein
MLKRTFTYTDYNGVERTEDKYFNLTKAEIMEMEMGTTGGLAEMIKRIVAAQEMPAIIKVFKDLVLKAYGEKSADGKHFLKIAPDGHRLADDFAQTEPYSMLFMELATSAEAASEFINGIVPADMSKAIAENKK